MSIKTAIQAAKRLMRMPQILNGIEVLTNSELEILNGAELKLPLGATSADVEKIVNDKILALLESGKELPPWKQSWAATQPVPAQNFVSKKEYTGSNSILLNTILADVMPTPYYATIKQIENLGGKIKKGVRKR